MAKCPHCSEALENGLATFCGACGKAIGAAPAEARLKRDLEGEAHVLRLSALSGVGRQLGGRYGVRGVPTFLLFDGSGEMVHYQVGRLDANRIKVEIDAMGR